MSKNKFPKMRTPKFRHPHGGGIAIPKYHRKRYGALAYFASITKDTSALDALFHQPW